MFYSTKLHGLFHLSANGEWLIFQSFFELVGCPFPSDKRRRGFQCTIKKWWVLQSFSGFFYYIMFFLIIIGEKPGESNVSNSTPAAAPPLLLICMLIIVIIKTVAQIQWSLQFIFLSIFPLLATLVYLFTFLVGCYWTAFMRPKMKIPDQRYGSVWTHTVRI